MPDSSEHKRSLPWLAIMLLASPLSVGPAAWLYRNGNLPEWAKRLLEVAYAPIDWALEHTETGSPIIQWYLEFWGD